MPRTLGPGGSSIAPKTSLSAESLAKLGIDRLAQLILDEAASNATFRRQVNAALAATKGAGGVTAIVDRRLKALEGAKGAISPDRERDVAADLRGILDIVNKDLAAIDKAGAAQRLIRFVGTFGAVLARVMGSGSRIAEVYQSAADAVPNLVENLSAADRALVPQWLAAYAHDEDAGLLYRMGAKVAPLLNDKALAAWDAALAQSKESSGLVRLRQAIAAARNDPDGFVALEAKQPDWLQRPVRVAQVLAAAGRFAEALDWVRKTRDPGTLLAVTREDIVDGQIGGPPEAERAGVEAGILDAMQDRAAAQALRWSTFVKTLDAATLRAYLAKLDEFTDQEELDKAFDAAEAFPLRHRALQFFVAWPKLDRAARLVTANAGKWHGGDYPVLGEAAAALADKYPLAASLLYRSLIDNILHHARHAAYGHAARYTKLLDGLAGRIDDWAGFDDHPAYQQGLRSLHRRKDEFWSLIKA